MKIVIFSPHATVVPHFETELEIAQLHLDQGDSVEYVGCQGELTNCDFNTNHDEARCQDCIGRRCAGLTLLTPAIESRSFTPTSSDVNRPDSFATVEDLIAFEIDNFDVGYAALSSLVSFIRDPEPDLEQHKDLLNRFVDSALQAYFFTLQLIERTAPDRVYVFNGRFAAMRAVLRACQRTGTDCQIHERGCDNQHFELYDNHLPHEILPMDRRIRKLWSDADGDERENVGASWFLDRVNRVEANWHSFVKKQKIGLLPENWNPNRKNISIFNSSDDEFVAIGGCWQNKLYPNQVEAIQNLVNQMRLDQPETHFYLRVHPNLAPVRNARKTQLLSLDSPNLTIIAPEAAIDSYELLKASDTVVSFGSSIGIEAVFWERPSVSLGSCFYQHLEGTYRPTSHQQTLSFLKADLKSLPKTGALMYGYWCQTRGQKYKYFEATGLFDGTFKDKIIYAGMNTDKEKSLPQKVKREAGRVLKKLTRLRPLGH